MPKSGGSSRQATYGPPWYRLRGVAIVDGSQKRRGMLRNWLVAVCRGSSGATLIEVLIGGVLVAIAAVGTALMFSSGQAFIASEGDNRVALQIAQERIERVRAGGFGSTMCCFPAVPALSPCDGREEPPGAPSCPTAATSWATDSVNHPGYRW